MDLESWDDMSPRRAYVVHDKGRGGHIRLADHGSRGEGWVVSNNRPPGPGVGHCHDSGDDHQADHHREAYATRLPAHDYLVFGLHCIPFAVGCTWVYDHVEAAYACLCVLRLMMVMSGRAKARNDRDCGRGGLSGWCVMMMRDSLELLFGRPAYNLEMAPNDPQGSQNACFQGVVHMASAAVPSPESSSRPPLTSRISLP